MQTPRINRLALVVAILAAFVPFLDGSIVNVALPAIADELGGGLPVQQWIVDAYLISLGAFILLAGSLSDLYGRVVILRVGLVAFGIASLACGLAPTAELLIAARAVQGLAGALLVPSSLALIMATHRGAAQARAIGIWTALTSAAFIVGPLVGGVLTDVGNWRWVFVINVVPITLTLILMIPMRNVPSAVKVPIDVAGAALGALALGGIAFALIEQANLGWGSPAVLTALVVGVASLVGFLVRERTAAHPMMPLELFGSRNFSAGNVATFAIYAALSVGSLGLTLYLQQSAGLSATVSGLVLLPVTVMLILLSATAGRLAGRYGPRWFMTVGPLVAAAGFLLLLSVGEPLDVVVQVIPGVLLFGLGVAITVAPLTSAILGAVDPTRSGIASAVNNAVARIAGLMAVAVLGAIVGTQIDGAWLDRVLILCAVLMTVGGIVSAIGIRTVPQRQG